MVVITVARKPLSEASVASNVLLHSTGALHIDGGRVAYEDTANPATNPLFRKRHGYRILCGVDVGGAAYRLKDEVVPMNIHPGGRWPANLVLSTEAAGDLDKQSLAMTGTPARASRLFRVV